MAKRNDTFDWVMICLLALILPPVGIVLAIAKLCKGKAK